MKKSVTIFTFLLVSCLFGFSQSRTTITLTDNELSVASYTDKEVVLNGKTDLHITATTAALTNSVINLNADNSWVFFDNIRPADVISTYLQFFNVNGQAAVLKTNIRVSIYKHGTVIIPQSSAYQPLTVFKGQGLTGDSAKYSLFTYNTALGTFNNTIRSFKLKRGYMATLAIGADGTGYSRVFIADKEDLIFSVLPKELDNTISFIRVFPWEWVSKKGWNGTDPNALGKVNATWCYDWSAFASTTAQAEYVPMHAKLTWAPFSQINGLSYSTHSLGFNEPDHGEQHKDDNNALPLTVLQALNQWPDMLKSGLRVGAPACTDFSWLYSFMDSCKVHNYRVDFVAVHAYWNSKTPQNWYNDLKYIYQKTGRPIWITEWNNGANWTTETWPTADRSLSAANAAKQLSDLKGILTVLDTASFIERYAIYDWVQDCRAMILGDTLTPAGKYYAADKPVLAFNRAKEVIPTFSITAPTLKIFISGTTSMSLISTDVNGEYNKGYVLEKKTNDGSYVEIKRELGITNVRYSETFDLTSSYKATYRIRTILPDGTESANSNEIAFDVTNGGDIQYGNLSVSNVGWNNVLFKQPYKTVPVIIFGSPTNNNFMVKFSNRVKQVNASRFTFQLAPWAYQNILTLSKAESVPYIILKDSTYDFGGLKAIAAKATVAATWTNITFSTPFDTIPVVFATQLTSAATNATGVRVKNITKTGFQAKIQKEAAIATLPASETVSYLAITPGKGILGDKQIIVGKTTNTAISATLTSTINYGDSIPDPVFLAQMQTCNDDTTATLRCQSITNTYAKIWKQRETSKSTATTAAEGAGWIVLKPINTIQGLNAVKSNEISVYPNPATNYLYFNQTLDENMKVDIYNMFGVMVKSEYVTDNKIKVNNLPSGYYIIKTSKNLVAKFIKI